MSRTKIEAELVRRLKRGETVVVRIATEAELAGLESVPNDCHGNVRRWCEHHEGDTPVRGYAVTSNVLDKHSVVDRGEAGLLDVSPIRDRDHTNLLVYHGSDAEFCALPNQIVIVDPEYLSTLATFLPETSAALRMTAAALPFRANGEVCRLQSVAVELALPDAALAIQNTSR